MNCPACEKPVGDGAKFCAACGSPVGALPVSPSALPMGVAPPTWGAPPMGVMPSSGSTPPQQPIAQSVPSPVPIYQVPAAQPVPTYQASAAPLQMPIYQTSAAQPQVLGQPPAKKLSVAAVVWCWVCIVMFFGLGFLNLGMAVAYDKYLPESTSVLVILLVSAMTYAAIGYIITLAGKRGGFIMACICAAASVVLALITETWFLAVVCLTLAVGVAVPILRGWSRWTEIVAAEKAARQRQVRVINGQIVSREQLAAAKAQLRKGFRSVPPQPASYPASLANSAYPTYSAYPTPQPTSPRMTYWIRGRRMKIWAIINTCCFFMTVVPIVAIIMAVKAQKATDERRFKTFYRWALILNIAPYVLFIPFGILINVIVALSG